jgi:hypothetical protein
MSRKLFSQTERPRLSLADRRRPYSVALTQAEKEALAARAQAENITVSEAIRQAIALWLGLDAVDGTEV